MMKRLLLSLAVTLIAGQALADIQDPPMNDYGPTRKLGRAWANMICAPTEVFSTVSRVNGLEGNSAAVTYGFVKGVSRMFVRMGVGVYEFVTYPFPTNRRSFRPVLRSNIPWVNGGYEEFPPELGFQSRKRYSTVYESY